VMRMWLQFLSSSVAKPRAKFLTVQKLDKQFVQARVRYGDDFGCCYK
jgi:hypothetical protein